MTCPEIAKELQSLQYDRTHLGIASMHAVYTDF